MIARALARFAGTSPDRIRAATGLMLDEFGLLTSLGIAICFSVAAGAGCALGYMFE